MNWTKRSAMIGAVIIVAVAGLTVWQWSVRNGTLTGIAVANGRIEAEEINVATKMPGRVIETLAEEGDFIEKESVLARLDASEGAAVVALRSRRCSETKGCIVVQKYGRDPFASEGIRSAIFPGKTGGIAISGSHANRITRARRYRAFRAVECCR